MLLKRASLNYSMNRMEEKNTEHPIYAYYRRRLEEVGLTEETNRREVMNDGRPQVIPIFYANEHKDLLDIPYVTPYGEMETYMDGKKLLTFSRTRFRVPKERKDENGKIKQDRYNQPPSTGVHSYCPPGICEKYRNKEEIRTLIIVEFQYRRFN